MRWVELCSHFATLRMEAAGEGQQGGETGAQVPESYWPWTHRIRLFMELVSPGHLSGCWWISVVGGHGALITDAPTNGAPKR